jgi:hypothetical protein
MKRFDHISASALFLVAIVACLFVPRTYAGRIWIFGTGLALLFTSMLNLLRLRSGYGVKGLRMFCVTANILMLALVVALMISIGEALALANPQIILVATLVIIEMKFSLGTNT